MHRIFHVRNELKIHDDQSDGDYIWDPCTTPYVDKWNRPPFDIE